MLDQNAFMETLHEVAEIIRTSGETLTKEQILSYFSDMELSGEQQELVFQYLLSPKEEFAAQEEKPKEKKKQRSKMDVLPSSKVFSMYLEELKNVPAYSEAELDKMYERLAEGETEVIAQLSDAWLKPVLKLAKKLAMSSVNFEDIVQEGNMSLFLKLTDLCGNREAWGDARESGLRKWAEHELEETVKLAMQASISELAGESDSESAMLGKVNLVHEARKYLAEENETLPTAAELAEYTRLSEEELTDILAMMDRQDRL